MSDAQARWLGIAQPLALFGSSDERPHFVLLASGGDFGDGTLFDMVYHAMFCSDEIDENHREEVDGVVQELREKGRISFEDGWLELCVGLPATIKFLTDKVNDQISELKYAEDKWSAEQRRAEENETRYRALRGALLMALSDKADIVVTAAA